MAGGVKNGGEKDSATEANRTTKTDQGGGEDGGGGGDEDHRCHWGPFGPACCQTFRRPAWYLLCVCWAAAVQGVVVNGFINVVISTVERRFQMSSTESGIIASCYDIASVLCLIPVSYFGGRGRKPVYLAVGMFVMGVGSFIFTLPHFTTGLYQWQTDEAKSAVCSVGDEDNSTSQCSGSPGSQLNNYKYVFYLGQLLHGAGASHLYTLGVIYLDENLPVRSTSLYMGTLHACAVFGPGIGFLAGGAFLNYFTDIDKLDQVPAGMTPLNPRWVGAWWIGFLISGTIGVVISLPLFGFPKTMPGSEKHRAERGKEVYKGKYQEEGVERQPLGLRHIVTSAKQLLTNPTFMFLNLAGAAEGVLISGLSTFGPKFIEFQFGLPAGISAMYIGLSAIIGGAGGTFLGGWLVMRFNWDVRRILRFCVIVTVVTVCLGLAFIIHCQNLPFAGISTDYMQLSPAGTLLEPMNMDATCNKDCGCSLYDYNPVCGRDNVMYYSPCYAGCQTSFAAAKRQYSNCSCVMYNFTAEDTASEQYWQAQGGKCKNDCPYLAVFVTLFVLLIFGIFISAMPALSASLRSVTEDQRSLGMGIQWIIARLLGTIPGPILFGKMLDLTCLVWQSSCQGRGACFYYDNKQMSLNLLAVVMTFNVLFLIVYILALVFYRSAPSSSVEVVVPAPADKGDSSHHTSMTTISSSVDSLGSERSKGVNPVSSKTGNSLDPQMIVIRL